MCAMVAAPSKAWSVMAVTTMLLLATLSSVGAGILPMQLTINQRSTECIYEKFEQDDHVTLSVFVTSGAELRGTAVLEGPVAPHNVDGGKDLYDAEQNFNSGTRYGDRSKTLSVEEVVDFEHLADDENFDDDDDNHTPDFSEEELAKMKVPARRAHEAKKKMAAKKKALNRRGAATKKVTEGEPFQHTELISVPGWYRACVRGSWYQITAEVEMRKASELGFDDTTGHVTSYQSREIMDEDIEMEKIEKAEGIKDEDFKTIKDQIAKLRRTLGEISRNQVNERHRLVIHSATNEHSHSRMVLGSLLETVLFMVVTGFQVFTIRKWFQGAPVLGR